MTMNSRPMHCLSLRILSMISAINISLGQPREDLPDLLTHSCDDRATCGQMFTAQSFLWLASCTYLTSAGSSVSSLTIFESLAGEYRGTYSKALHTSVLNSHRFIQVLFHSNSSVCDPDPLGISPDVNRSELLAAAAPLVEKYREDV